VIDLRSDTVTLPSPAMREAMAHAEVGDDVYGEDPTVNRLEAQAAQRMGKEAAVLVPSGTMGNLSALLAHCQRGQRVVLGSESHIFHYELGGASALGGLVYHMLPNLPDGTLEPGTLEEALASDHYDIHLAPVGVVCLENTHNRCGGAVLTPDYMAAVHARTQQHGVPLHLDGARIFNAAVALNSDVRELTRHVDSVQFCLSKGLSAPVGSLVAGSAAFIQRVRRMRKMLGGGMRQAGVIAAAGLVALNEMVERLEEDHLNARLLAEGLAAIPGIVLEPEAVQTDIVIFGLSDTGRAPGDFLAALKEQGVLMGEMGGNVRAVTHYGISSEDVQAALQAVQRVLA
jgi:threonine aldolase